MPIRTSELSAGMVVMGFEGWECVPDRARRTVQRNVCGFWVKCTHGKHYLDAQETSGLDDTLVGMERAEGSTRFAKRSKTTGRGSTAEPPNAN
jgi:hypothetical protein